LFEICITGPTSSSSWPFLPDFDAVVELATELALVGLEPFVVVSFFFKKI